MTYSYFFQLAADPDQNVRSGSELLDRLMKVKLIPFYLLFERYCQSMVTGLILESSYLAHIQRKCQRTYVIMNCPSYHCQHCLWTVLLATHLIIENSYLAHMCTYSASFCTSILLSQYNLYFLKSSHFSFVYVLGLNTQKELGHCNLSSQIYGYLSNCLQNVLVYTILCQSFICTHSSLFALRFILIIFIYQNAK